MKGKYININKVQPLREGKTKSNFKPELGGSKGNPPSPGIIQYER